MHIAELDEGILVKLVFDFALNMLAVDTARTTPQIAVCLGAADIGREAIEVPVSSLMKLRSRLSSPIV